MPRYDYRVRRQLFQNRNIDKYKNFNSLEKQFEARNRTHKLVRLLLILLALLLFTLTIVFVSSASERDHQDLPGSDPIEFTFKNIPEKL